jgi:hypothetical protein
MLVVVFEVHAKRICEPEEKRVGRKTWRKPKILTNNRRRPTRCQSWSFPTRWSAGKAMVRKLKPEEERRRERGSIRCSPPG